MFDIGLFVVVEWCVGVVLDIFIDVDGVYL